MTKSMIRQLRTGKVKELGTEGAKDPMDRPWRTGIFKKEQSGELMVLKDGLEMDQIGDTKQHGGPEKALFAYPVAHYAYWRDDLKQEIGAGAMGENLVMEGIDESSVCLGDVFQAGEAVIEVSQPRQPCWKPARRFRVIDFALRIQRSGRTGWYFRVLQEGKIKAGIPLQLIERPYPEWTIAACNEVMHVKKKDLALTAELAACPALAPNWKRTLDKRLKGQKSRLEKRVYGPNKSDRRDKNKEK